MSECHHGWRGSKPDGAEVIRTPCPACGGQLFIGGGGHLTCSVLRCNHDPGIENYWKEQKAEMTRLLAEVAELRADKERLDCGTDDGGCWREGPEVCRVCNLSLAIGEAVAAVRTTRTGYIIQLEGERNEHDA